jgi:hypothetical protein
MDRGSVYTYKEWSEAVSMINMTITNQQYELNHNRMMFEHLSMRLQCVSTKSVGSPYIRRVFSS